MRVARGEYVGIAKKMKQVDKVMKIPPFTNLAVSVIFFGIALIEALQKQAWLEAGLFLALGVLSLWADFKKS